MGKPAPAPVTYTLLGTSGSDQIDFLGGSLTLNGSAKTITPGATQITINGSDGNDTIRTDALHTFGGAPVMYDGGAGVDTLDFSSATEAVDVQLSYSTSKHASPGYIETGFSLVSVYAQSPAYYDPGDPQKVVVSTASTVQTYNVANIENLVGSAYDDVLGLGGTAGHVDGGAGNDYIQGGIGADFLNGGTGDDFLFGKAGNDTMTGGSGADQFQVLTLNGVDVITDFNTGEGDHLYIGWQSSTDTIPNANSWYATTWTDPQGVSHQAIEADFTGGGVILADHTLADIASVMASTTTFHYFG